MRNNNLIELVSALFLSLMHQITVNALCESVRANDLQGGEALQGFLCHWVIHKYKLMKLSENAWEDEKGCRKGSLSPFLSFYFLTLEIQTLLGTA